MAKNTVNAENIIANEAAEAARLKLEGDNILAIKSAVMAEIAVIGVAAADGAMSTTDLAIRFNTACRDKVFTADDAKAVYVGFLTAKNDSIARRGLTGVSPESTADDDVKSKVSIFKTFGLPAVLAQGGKWFETILTVKAGMSVETLSAYNCFVKCNREVAKLGEKAVVLTDVKVSDAQIAEWIAKKVNDPKDDLAKLMASIKSLQSLQDKAFPELTQAIRILSAFHSKNGTGMVEIVADSAKNASPIVPMLEAAE